MDESTDTDHLRSDPGHVAPDTSDPPGRGLAHVAGTVRQWVVARTAGLPSWVLLIELFIGLGWLRAATEKVIDPQWWTGEAIRRFLVEHQGQALGWYRPFVDAVVSPAAILVALTVLILQLTAGLCLVSGRRRGLALGGGILLNLHFMAAGAVSPSAFYLLAQATLVLWLVEQRPTVFSTRRLALAAGVATVAASASLPFISTVDPAHVIEDPAMMFVFGGALTIVACAQAASTVNAARRIPRTDSGSRARTSLSRRAQ